MATSKGSKEPKITQNPLTFYAPEGPKVDGPLMGGNLPFDPDGMKRAAERVFGPRQRAQELAELRQAQAEDRAKITALEKTAAKHATAGKSRREAQLRTILRGFGKSNPGRCSDQLFIALGVDKHLKKNGMSLQDVCPKKWKKYLLPGDRLVDLLDPRSNSKLHKLVKPYITKAVG